MVLLQKEMSAEQEHFSMLSEQVGELTEGSPEFHEVADEIVASQRRLGLLMGRNMKCFTRVRTPGRFTGGGREGRSQGTAHG